MKLLLCLVLLFSCMISAGESDFGGFSLQLDKYGNAANKQGWSLIQIGGPNDTLQAATWELVSDTSSAEVGLISLEVWISSSSATDASGGNGAQSVEVFYYTTAGAIASTVVAMNGQSTVSVGVVKQILGARVKYEGSSGQQGDIYVHSATVASGVPNQESKTYAKIPADQGATQNGLFYVPPGAKAVIEKIVVNGNGTTLTMRLMSKKSGQAERALIPKIYAALGISTIVNVDIPLEAEELVWMEAIGVADSNCSTGIFLYYKE